jgi:hypothetical protein
MLSEKVGVGVTTSGGVKKVMLHDRILNEKTGLSLTAHGWEALATCSEA